MRTLNELRVIQLEAKQKERKERLSEVAPEMLEMLKKLHKSCLNHRGGKRRKLGELIAKAEGGE